MLWLLWLSGAVLLYCIALFFFRKKHYPIAFYSVVVSFLLPIVPVGIYCVRNAASEACVWGQGFLPFYWLVSLLLFAPLMWGIMNLFFYVYKKYGGFT